MKLTHRKPTTGGDADISFPMLESWQPVTKVATIAAEISKRRILCRISLKTLKEKFGASDKVPMQSVTQHRQAIQEAAKRLIEKEAYEEDGSVLIRARDL